MDGSIAVVEGEAWIFNTGPLNHVLMLCT